MSQIRGLTKGKKVGVEVWFWVGMPPESSLREKMVDILRGDMYMESLSLDKRS